MKRERMYGMMAEFDSATALVEAARKTHQAGYNKIDAYSPFPIEGLAEEIGFHRDEVPLVVLIGGIIGGLTGYLMQWWMSAVDYPINIGGKPLAFVACVHRHHLRDDDPLCRNLRRIRHVGAEWLAHALSSRIQRSAIFVGIERPLLPDRVFFRSQVRRGGYTRFSPRPRPALDLGGAKLECRASAKCRPFPQTLSVPSQTMGAPFLRVLCARVGFHESRTLWDFATLGLLLAAMTLLSACRLDMQVQPKQNPLSRSDFFSDQRSERPPVEGTVARGQLHEDTYFYTRQSWQQPRRLHAVSRDQRSS